MKISLPSLDIYKKEFEYSGVKTPLKKVPFNNKGFLDVLPPITDKTGWPWTEQTDAAIYDPKINWPKITIVTPSFNQGEFIEETIRSVLLQNYPNLEYIVIDGGSTDDTCEILEKYSPWISYWQSKKDNGQGQAINLGFSLACGDYYGWINSDDYYLKNVFHKVISTFIESKAVFIYGYAYNYNVGSKKFELMKIVPLLDIFLRIPTLAQPACFWRSTIHQPIWEALYCSLDYELWLRLVKGNRRKLIREPLSVANTHEEAKTYDPKMKAKWEHDHLLICGKDAHGRVKYWNKLFFLYKIWKKLQWNIHY